MGIFTTINGVANASYIAKYDGTSWTAVGNPNTGTATITAAFAIAIDADDNIYVGGDFTDWANDGNAHHWAWWNGTAWAAVDDIAISGGTTVTRVFDMLFDDAGVLYVIGDFTDVDGVSNADYVFAWTGTAVEALGTGLSDYGLRLAMGPDGMLYAGGLFGAAGGVTITDRSARWNGSTWSGLDLDTAFTTLQAIACGDADPTVPENYDIYVGGAQEGAAYFAGTVTATNSGSAPAYPQVIISRSGGTSARVVSVRNARTGRELFLNYLLLDGETLTIDLHPDRQTVTSSFFGSRPDAVLAGSDMGTFMLLPGANQITAFVNVVGAPTVTGYVLWRDSHDGVDD